MLREFDNVRQHEGEGRRRWFADQTMDLVLWYDPKDPARITGFQLCYDKNAAEHALTWRESGSVSHHAVDGGESTVHKNMSPILVPDGVIPLPRIRDLFDAASGTLDPEVRDFVSSRLAEIRG